MGMFLNMSAYLPDGVRAKYKKMRLRAVVRHRNEHGPLATSRAKVCFGRGMGDELYPDSIQVPTDGVTEVVVIRTRFSLYQKVFVDCEPHETVYVLVDWDDHHRDDDVGYVDYEGCGDKDVYVHDTRPALAGPSSGKAFAFQETSNDLSGFDSYISPTIPSFVDVKGFCLTVYGQPLESLEMVAHGQFVTCTGDPDLCLARDTILGFEAMLDASEVVFEPRQYTITPSGTVQTGLWASCLDEEEWLFRSERYMYIVFHAQHVAWASDEEDRVHKIRLDVFVGP